MNRAAIITLAGLSTRFRKSLGKDVLKAIYKENGYKSILDILLDYCENGINDIYIVAGYKYDDLKDYIDENYKNLNINIIYNKNFTLGSNESLLCGIRALNKTYDEVLFIEGDLIIDKESFNNIIEDKSNVITSNKEQINAQTSVLYYVNKNNKIVYKYDTKHELLEITEAFKTISNSGQIWKFTDITLLKEVCSIFLKEDMNNTNLATIDKYFNKILFENISFVEIKQWFNCNTINDYKKGIKNAKYK